VSDTYFKQPELPEGIDPDASPFSVPPIEGIPFEKGSEEDEAIKRILREDWPSAVPGESAEG
jgi:hypothetical protein